MLVITQLAVTYLGRAGIDTLAAIMGVSDVDPFIMGLTQAPSTVHRAERLRGRDSHRRRQQQCHQGNLRI